MPSDIETLRHELETATRQFDRRRVAGFCDELTGAIVAGQTVSIDDVKAILGTLRRKRHFPEIRRVAECLIQTGRSESVVRRQYAQALIDSGDLAAAIGLLECLVAETRRAGDVAENAEARGLLGRARKQIYVNSRRTDAHASAVFKQAIEGYLSVYSEDPESNLWHGINAVACLDRASRDGLGLDRAGFPDPKDLAQAIREEIEEKQKPNAWDCATAMEASVALGDPGGAMQWMGRYVASPGADAFELESTRRQLVEVWQLERDCDPGDPLLPLLEAMLLRAEGGRLDLRSSDVVRREQASHYEKSFGPDTYMTMKWVDQGRRLCRAVARVSTSSGQGVGTGFLVRGRDLAPCLGDEVLMLTNSHVISEDAEVHDRLSSSPLNPDEAEIEFADGDDQGRRVAKVLWSSPPWELDSTLVRLIEPPSDGVLCEPHERLPAPERARVYIIGHPFGGKLSWSLHDNYLLDHEDPKIHYRTPTDPGSSGSPVFNGDWKLIGLHHSGSDAMKKLNRKPGTYQANEGIWIQAVRRAVRQKLEEIPGR